MSSSEFISKIDYYCHKKESLFDKASLNMPFARCLQVLS